MENTMDSTMDTTRRNADHMVDRMAQSAHETVERMAARAAPAMDRLQEGATQAGDTLRDKAHALDDLQQQWLTGARDYVRQRPLAALGVAVVAGMLVSRWIR